MPSHPWRDLPRMWRFACYYIMRDPHLLDARETAICTPPCHGPTRPSSPRSHEPAALPRPPKAPLSPTPQAPARVPPGRERRLILPPPAQAQRRPKEEKGKPRLRPLPKGPPHLRRLSVSRSPTSVRSPVHSPSLPALHKTRHGWQLRRGPSQKGKVSPRRRRARFALRFPVRASPDHVGPEQLKSKSSVPDTKPDLPPVPTCKSPSLPRSFPHHAPQPSLFPQTTPSSMSRSTQTLPLAQRPQTSSTPSSPPSLATQARPTRPRPPRPLPRSPNCNRPSQTRRGRQSRYTPSPTTRPRPNSRIPLLIRRDCPCPNRPLPQPPTHLPPPPLSRTLPRSFRVLPRTLRPISHTPRPILRAPHRPCPHAIPATPPPQRAFAYTRERLVPIHSSPPHTPRPRPQARPPTAVWTTFPLVVFFLFTVCQLNMYQPLHVTAPYDYTEGYHFLMKHLPNR